jgi:hypothetical protein
VSRLVFRNQTVYPDAEVRALVRFAFADLDLPEPRSIVIRIRHTRNRRGRRYGATGMAYPYVYVKPDVPEGAAYEIHLNIGRPDVFPCSWQDRATAPLPIGMLADWQEALVVIAAHEGKHVEVFQQNHRNPWRKPRRTRSSSHALEDRCEHGDPQQQSAHRASTEATRRPALRSPPRSRSRPEPMPRPRSTSATPTTARTAGSSATRSAAC